jgi:hypothetical protein
MHYPDCVLIPKGDKEMFRLFKNTKMTGFLVLAVAAVTGTSAYAFTASNTGLGAHKSGVTDAAVSGYTVGNPSYTYDPATGNTTAVTFTLDAAASDVYVTLLASPVSAASWNDCGASGALTPFTVTCTFDGLTTDHAAFTPAQHQALQIIAVSTGQVTL